jgi:hypothetical protein
MVLKSAKIVRREENSNKKNNGGKKNKKQCFLTDKDFFQDFSSSLVSICLKFMVKEEKN